MDNLRVLPDETLQWLYAVHVSVRGADDDLSVSLLREIDRRQDAELARP